jgi:hypothetical protein
MLYFVEENSNRTFMPKTFNNTSKKRHGLAHAESGAFHNGARKKSPASVMLRTKAGRRVITSPAKSATSLANWSEAFSGK